MLNRLEILPNEILSNIFCYLSWNEILISLWSLNKRFNSLFYSIFSINKKGVVFNKPDLSYETLSSILLPRIFNSSLSLYLNIKYIHFDESYSIPLNFICERLFSTNDQQRICFPGLKSLYITRCIITESLIEILSLLIRYQLDQLTLTFHEDIYQAYNDGRRTINMSDKGCVEQMFEQFLCQIFSNQCQLTYLHLDMSKSSYYIHHCLKDPSYFSSKIISNEFESYCTSLRYLNIHLGYTCFLEHLINYVPNLEQLSVSFPQLRRDNQLYDSNLQRPILPNENWFNKIPKLKSFKLKSYIYNDTEFVYLKWLLNNLNHITKLKIYVRSPQISRPDQIIWKSVIDTNFIRQYYLPDKIINLKYFYIYIGRKYQLSVDDIENINNSFKTDSFFISHQWTNIKCFYDENISYQHIFSSNLNRSELYDGLSNQIYMHDWSYPQHICIYFDLSLYLSLRQFEKQFPNVTSITVRTEYYFSKLAMEPSSVISLKMEELNLSNIQLRNITTLRLETCYSRSANCFSRSINRKKLRAKLYANLMSMPVQLKYLSIENFEYFLHVIEYADKDLRKNALSTIRYAEFGIQSCNIGSNEAVNIGKHLIPVLNTYMRSLHTLRLWRPDDFPWTSLRPIFNSHRHGFLMRQWTQTLETPQCINEHVIGFEQDLCQLHEQLKHLVFLEIYGLISCEKVQLYRLMAQTRFPNSQIDVQMSRFRLWM